MPLPDRYEEAVSDMAAIWKPAGYFEAQGQIWVAESEARNYLEGSPNNEELDLIRRAVVLSPEEVKVLSEPKGHETNKYLRTVQSRPYLTPEAGNFVHLGNTSSDVLDTSLALQFGRSMDILDTDFSVVEGNLSTLALQHALTLQIGRTHGQHAIPQTFGRQVLGWYAEVGRDRERIARAKDVMAVGKLSGEVGTNVFISPEIEEESLRRLGLRVDPAPSQVISRDRHAEALGLLAVNAGTLHRIANNIRVLAITDIGEVREPFDEAAQQGSSAMPHKRNPELTERIMGLSRRVYGAAREELDCMPLLLDRDISHSSAERFTFPDLLGALCYSARLTSEVLGGLVVYQDNMLANMDKTVGCIYSPRLLNRLIETGQFTRTQAYESVKALALKALEDNTPMIQLARGNDQISGLIGGELEELFSPGFYLKNIKVAYKRLGLDPDQFRES